MYAKQNTAKTFLVGPILDADGAAKTDEVIGSIKVTKNGTVGDPNASSTLTHDHTGHYVYAANAGDFDTLGEVEFSLNSGTNAMAPVRFMVVPANVYDAMVSGTDKLEVDATQWDGSTVPVFPANFASLGINASGHVSRVTLVDTCTQNSDMRGTDGAATPADLGDLQTHGDTNWTTATGFATSAALAAVGDKVEAILEDTSITGVVMAGYTAPDNEGIAAIKAQTDKLAFVGGDVKATLDGEKVAATLAAGDVTGNLPATVNAYAPSLEPVAIDTAAIAEAARDAILNRILAGNHDAAGTAGALLQKLDVGGDIANTSNADSFKATGFAVPGSPMTLTSDERNAVADAVLSRDVANAESSAAEHSLCTIVLASLESSISGTAWTIKRTDGVTTHATKTLTTDETADPITGVS
jgi:hypothetical protein